MTAEGVCCAGEHLQKEGQAACLLGLPMALGSSHVFPVANVLSAQVEGNSTPLPEGVGSAGFLLTSAR